MIATVNVSADPTKLTAYFQHMADASRSFTDEPPNGTVTLSLTPEQAVSLYAVTRQIGGMPEGRRGHLDAVRRQLDSHGLRTDDVVSGSLVGVLVFPDEIVD